MLTYLNKAQTARKPYSISKVVQQGRPSVPKSVLRIEKRTAYQSEIRSTVTSTSVPAVVADAIFTLA